jgi:hypothetical protein
MDEITSDVERMTEEFDSTKLPKDFKREVREEWHFQLWLMQKTYKEIEAITGFERTCIWNDIKRVQARLAATPKTIESIIQTAMMSLRITAAEATAAARTAQDDDNVRWDRVAKLFDVAASIHKTILTRFTQPALVKQPDAADDQKSQIILEFIVMKFGPEGLDGFDEYYTRQLNLKRNLGAASTEEKSP